MSFQKVPSLFRIPEVPGFTPPNSIWRGKGGDEGFFAMDVGGGWGGRVIVREPNFCYKLQFDNRLLSPVYSDCNGFGCWSGSGYVYMTQGYGWVWCDRFPGYEPLEDVVFESGETKWKGDPFYSFSRLPMSLGDTITMEPRGSLRETGEEKTLKAVWPRWEAKGGEFGEYEGKDGEFGVRVKGLPRFVGDGEYFVRSLNKENGRFAYGRIHYAGGKWVIGEIGSDGGWHEGAEPEPGGSVTFRFCKPEGSEAEGSDISVAFRDYVCGDETEAAYLGSVAIWR